MEIITLSGVDGSGKSTQLKLLKERLEAAGKRVAYFHAVEFSLANCLSRFLKGGRAFEPGREAGVTRASWLSVILRKKFLFLDLLRFRIHLRTLARAGYDVLLSDRYFYDSLVNLAYLESQASVSYPLLERLIIPPTRAYYLSVAAEDVMRRERAPEQGADYLKQKIALFEQKKEAWRMVSVDASRLASEVSSSIV